MANVNCSDIVLVDETRHGVCVKTEIWRDALKTIRLLVINIYSSILSNIR